MPIRICNMTAIPANSNPFHHMQATKIGQPFADRYVAICAESLSDEVVIVDTLTGNRIKLIFPSAAEKPARKPSERRKLDQIRSFVDLRV